MSNQNQYTFTALFASIAARLFSQPSQRDIVAKPAKRPLVIDVEPATTIPQFVPFVEPDWQPVSSEGQPVIVLVNVNLQPKNEGSGRPHVTPLNRGAAIRERCNGGARIVRHDGSPASAAEIAAYYAGEYTIINDAPDIPRQGWER